MASVGCGDDEAGVADAGADAAEPDAEINFCTILEANYGDLGTVNGDALYAPQEEDDPTGPQLLSIRIPLNTDANPDLLVIELFEDAGPFEPDLATGNYGIIDMETDVIACGTCVYIAGDFTTPDAVDFHMASSGTLAIDTLDLTPETGKVIGSLTDIKMRNVTISGGQQVVTPMGCKTQVESLAFDFNVTVPPAARQRAAPSLAKVGASLL